MRIGRQARKSWRYNRDRYNKEQQIMKQCIVSGMRVFLSMCLFIGFTSSASFALDPPTGVSASDGTYPSEVRVTWNSVPGANHYRVYRNTSNNSSGAIALGTWQTGTAYDDFSVSVGQTYWYWVKAATSSSGARVSALSNYNTGYADNSVPVDPCYCPPGQICPTLECDEILFSPTSSGLLDEYILSDNHLIFPAELPDQATFSEEYDRNISAVPEPTTVVLFVLGLLGLSAFLRRSRKKP